LNALSPDALSTRKAAIVAKAWAAMDPSGSGQTTGAAAAEVMCNKDQVACFLDNFAGTAGGNCDGAITQCEFEHVCKEMSVSIPNDGYFVANVSEAFGVTEDEATPVIKQRVMYIINLMRQRLITLANSSQEEYVLRNMFRTFDLDNSGCISAQELRGLLAKLGVVAEDKEVAAVMRELDLNKSGTLEFEEFSQFVLVDPYTDFDFKK
jgi:Ca2+-binding EF-hand superfamily protein